MSSHRVAKTLSMYPSEAKGLELLRAEFELRTVTDVIRRLVWRHRHIKPAIKERFRRARRARA